MGYSKSCWYVHQLTSLQFSIPNLHDFIRSVFNKLIVTALKYTPVVLAQHVPYKEVAGKLFVLFRDFFFALASIEG